MPLEGIGDWNPNDGPTASIVEKENPESACFCGGRQKDLSSAANLALKDYSRPGLRRSLVRPALLIIRKRRMLWRRRRRILLQNLHHHFHSLFQLRIVARACRFWL